MVRITIIEVRIITNTLLTLCYNINMIFNIFIADDDEKITSRLECYILDWADQYHQKINLQKENDLSKVAVESLIPYDLVILDIEIGSVNGIEFAKSLRKAGSDATIAFISNYSQYAVEGYSARAISYILKPINEEKIFSLLNDALYRIGDFSSKTIWFSQNGRKIFISTNSILYIESQRKKVDVYLKDKKESFVMPLQSLEPQLPNTSLIRCHRSYIVNIDYIRKLVGNDLYIEGDSAVIPIGTNYREDIKKRLLCKRGT